MNNNDSQYTFDFDAIRWPNNKSFPLNIKPQRNVESIIYSDIESSREYIIITGFTSLSNLIDFFGSKDINTLEKVRILIGFEPNIRGRKKYLKSKLDKEIKDYWLKKGVSIILGGAVINLIEKIDQGKIEFKYKDKLHAKLYIGDRHAVLGSSNFSKNGLNFQEEANIRVSNITENKEKEQYESIKLIAESYYEEAALYNEKIKELLKNLIQKVTWEEALARAISEILEGSWLAEYKSILEKLEQSSLWPTQWKGIAQAVSILQNHSNVLIADPTGAGKTKLCTSLILALKHWLYEIGKNYQTNSLIICPPLVVPKWKEEFRSLRKINDSQLSMGLLSNSPKRKKDIIEDLELTNILAIDEAHNYLSPNSNRTNLIKKNKANYKILVTATPISKKVEDLLILIELLDIDNLTDENFEIYKELKNKPYKRNNNDDIENLRKFISNFTVRRTKKILNKEIEKEPDKYHNKLNVVCKFPKQIEKTYKTNETSDDIEIVKKINELASLIKGVTYLSSFHKPNFEITREDSLQAYINKRLSAGRALSIYMIRAALRSSHVALVEHIEGTQKAMNHFDFEGKTNKTGNKIRTIEKLIAGDKLPKRNKIFKDEFFPNWLLDKKEYIKVCREELNLYKDISALAKQLSGERELGKVKQLIKVSKKHENILAFDSTVITLYYLKKLFKENFSEQNILVASGSESDRDSKKVLEIFHLQSESTENYTALCSDKMSESIDLQKASSVLLLDLPSVLRIVEQRIGRVDRMDSMHKEIEIYWPEDSEEYSLKADSRLVQTNEMVEQIYGTNFNVPDALKERHFNNVDSVSEIIEEFKEFVDKDESWSGVHDSFQSIVNLKEGNDRLIDEAIYEEFKDVSSSIKTRVSFLKSEKNWCFLAFRGDKNKSPKWYFIDNEKTIHSDFTDICLQLRKHINGKASSLEWNNESLITYIKLFKQKERELLPPKKKRAIEVAEFILEKKKKLKEIDPPLRIAINEVLNMLKPNLSNVVDYERLAEEWIIILQPYIDEKRLNNRRKKNIYNLNDLKRDHKRIEITIEMLNKLIEKTPIVDDIDNKIASCIIGINSTPK
jgi:superfamily II DNA or RNA helicase